jgi:hypothetical protein
VGDQKQPVNPFILSAHISELIQLQNETISSINFQIKRPQMEVSIRDSKAHLRAIRPRPAEAPHWKSSHRRVVARVTGIPESGTPALGELIAKGAAQGDGNKPQGAHIVLSKGGTPVSRIVLDDRG